MCGISGIVYFSQKTVHAEDINKMLRTIKHRGPDDEGVFIKNNVGLGHVRLSIIDLSAAGHQPFFSNDQRYCITFNGEIYNYLELRNELKNKYQFRTQTDTEVLLAAYIVWGEDCLPKLNGDFAFVIYDQQENKFFGARDRFGIKPFYYYHDPDCFVFASEAKAIRPIIGSLKPNNKIIFEFLVYNRTEQSHETFFDKIVKLKHGYYFTIKQNEFKTKQWYNLKDSLHYPSPLTPEEYREELRKSIKLRLRSDVPLGVCLSGGVDSSSLTSILYHDFNIKELQTFSTVFEKGEWADESVYIDLFRNTLQNMYFVRPTAQSFSEEFDNFITSFGEPIPSVSPYAQYKVMQLAKGKVTVTLDGQGSDEMLCGYAYFFGCYFKELLKSFQLFTLLKESFLHFRKNVDSAAYTYFIYYTLPVSLKKYAGKKSFGSITNEFYLQHHAESTITSDLYNPKTLKELSLQHFDYKLEHLLKWDDLNAMSFSIESRVPFLDHNLVEKTLSLPSDLILKDGISKDILRKSVKDILPEKIYRRTDKRGFSTPTDKWFRTEFFKGYINDLLHSKKFNDRNYFNVEDCKKKYQLHLDGKADLSKDIWKWINLEVWFQKFIDH